MSTSMSGYRALAKDILRQAVKDSRLQQYTHDIIGFLRSDMFKSICSLLGVNTAVIRLEMLRRMRKKNRLV